MIIYDKQIRLILSVIAGLVIRHQTGILNQRILSLNEAISDGLAFVKECERLINESH